MQVLPLTHSVPPVQSCPPHCPHFGTTVALVLVAAFEDEVTVLDVVFIVVLVPVLDFTVLVLSVLGGGVEVVTLDVLVLEAGFVVVEVDAITEEDDTTVMPPGPDTLVVMVPVST